MENESRIRVAWKQLMDKLGEQQWFRELKAKWDELDPQSRRNARVGGLAAVALTVGGIILSSMYTVAAKRSDFNDKSEILGMIRNASEEMRSLKGGSRPASADGMPNWPAYFRGKATNAGLDASTITVSTEKKGNSGNSTIESMFDVSLKRVNVRQLAKYAFYLQNGEQPVKLKHLKIDTDGDEGHLNASLDVSAFSLKKKEDEK
ncbi:MAG: hypothetical protein IT285_13460 [Bdellovibrionales bacterium]|nr:hypothetical protein [Bdellovibrionales bacterium]